MKIMQHLRAFFARFRRTPSSLGARLLAVHIVATTSTTGR